MNVVVDEEMATSDENEGDQADNNSNEGDEGIVDEWDRIPEVGEESLGGKRKAE